MSSKVPAVLGGALVVHEAFVTSVCRTFGARAKPVDCQQAAVTCQSGRSAPLVFSAHL